jgi:8-oxo-dGTP pyrophosphatase MutT (NUDIX family)
MILQKGFLFEQKFINLKNILKNVNTKYENCEWGFPKGKKKNNEENIFCAIREFEEETGIEKWDLINIPSIYEKHLAINENIYKTDLFFINTNSESLDLSKCDKNEISDIKWFSKENIINEIREYQSYIINSIEIAEKTIIEYHLKNEKNENLLDNIKQKYLSHKNENENSDIVNNNTDIINTSNSKKYQDFYKNIITNINIVDHTTENHIKNMIFNSYINKTKIALFLN